MRRLELIITMGEKAGYADSMRTVHRRISDLSDSLQARLPDRSAALGGHVDVLGRETAAYAMAVQLPDSTRAQEMADSIFLGHLRPSIRSILAELPILEDELLSRTSNYFIRAAASAEDAERAGMIGLLLATVLVAAIALWLTRSIGAPVRDLEEAMRTVSDGDYSYVLSTEQRSPSEFSRLARSYRSMVDQLAELDKLKAEFVSIASHELKTPINVLIGYLQLMDEGVYGELNAEQREICRILESQAQSLARLVHQLLEVSRFEAGAGRLETRSTDLNELVTELHDSFAVLAMQRGVELRVSLANDLPGAVQWDADRVKEVVGNILSNAFNFTPRGGTVELAVYRKGDEIHLDIRDTGAGIPPKQLPHVFEKFYQAANQGAASSEGTGLGLAIAREIVEAHMGRISVESKVAVGTTFRIVLPQQSPSGREMRSRRLTPAVGPAGAGS
jgi:signal transduction histidine kinase